MKALITSTLLLFGAITLTAQVPYAKTEWCKAEGVEITVGETFPENYSVVAFGNFFRETGITTLAQITPQIRKQMQRLAVEHHSCKIFVDFANIVSDHQDADGNDMSKTYIYYYAIRPVQYLAKGVIISNN